MNKPRKQNEFILKLLANLILTLSSMGLILITAFPTILLFNILFNEFQIASLNLLFLIKIILTPIIMILFSVIQVIWLGIVVSIIDTINGERTFFEALKYYKKEWDKAVKNIFNGKSIYD